MEILNYSILSEAANTFNEDIAHVAESSAWILDGSSGLHAQNYTGCESDGRWFVKKWNRYLQEAITDNEKTLKNIVIEGIDFIKNSYFNTVSVSNIDPIFFPSSAIVIARINKTELEYLILGDCTLIVDSINSPIKVIVDDRIDVFDNRAIKEIQKIQKKEQLSLSEAREKTLPLLRKHRNLKNKKNGYWILEFDKNAVQHSIYRKEKLHGETHLMLMSDGFAQLSTTFKKTKSTGDILSLSQKSNLNDLYRELREFAEKDNEGLIYPRLKKIDDASVILMKIGTKS